MNIAPMSSPGPSQDSLVWLATAILVPMKWPKSATPLTILTLLLSFVVLGIGGYIAHAGGKIRHREFRNEPAPPVPVEQDEH